MALNRPRRPKLAEALDELATSRAAAAFRRRNQTTSNCFRRALAGRVVRRAPQPGIARAHPRPARSAPDRAAIASCSAAWSRASWPPESPQRSVAQPADAPALGLDLPERRIGLSGARFRATPRRARGRSRATPPRSPARRQCRRASCSGSPRSPARAGKSAVKRGELISPGRASSTGRSDVKPATQPAPKPPRAARPKRPFGHRDRGLAARSLYDLRRHILRLRPLDAVDTEPGAAERGTIIHAAVGDFTAEFRGRSSRRSGARTDRARRTALRRAGGFSGGARVLVAAFPAHRALVRALGRRAACRHRRARRRNPRRDRDRA